MMYGRRKRYAPLKAMISIKIEGSFSNLSHISRILEFSISFKTKMNGIARAVGTAIQR